MPKQNRGGKRKITKNNDISQIKGEEYHGSDSIERAKGWMNVNSNNREWNNNLTDEEKSSLWMYSDIDYEDINKMLWGDASVDKGYMKNVKVIDSAIGKFELDDNIKAYRNDFELNQKVKVGDVISHKGYTSTSIRKESINEITYSQGDTLVITIPKGKGRGAYIAGTSSRPDEFEFLIKRGASFRVTKIEKTYNSFVNELRNEIHVEMIN